MTPSGKERGRLAIIILLTGVGAGLIGIVLAVLLHVIQHVAFGYDLHAWIGTESFFAGASAAAPARRVLVLVVCGVVAGGGWYLVHRYAHPLVSVDRAVRADDPRLPGRAITADGLLQDITVALGSPLGREVAPRQISAALASWLALRASLSVQDRGSIRRTWCRCWPPSPRRSRSPVRGLRDRRWRPICIATTAMARRTLVLSGALLGSTIASGCLVGPSYEVPPAPVPYAAHYKEAGRWKVATPADALPRGAWWAMFREPELDTLQAQLNITNQTIAAAAESYIAARAQVRVAEAQYFPAVTAMPSLARGHSPGVVGANPTSLTGGLTTGGGAGFTGYFKSYVMAGEASWVPDLFGRVRYTVRQRRYAAQASAADLERSTSAFRHRAACTRCRSRHSCSARRACTSRPSSTAASCSCRSRRHAISASASRSVTGSPETSS